MRNSIHQFKMIRLSKGMYTTSNNKKYAQTHSNIYVSLSKRNNLPTRGYIKKLSIYSTNLDDANILFTNTRLDMIEL